MGWSGYGVGNYTVLSLKEKNFFSSYSIPASRNTHMVMSLLDDKKKKDKIYGWIPKISQKQKKDHRSLVQ